MKAIISTILILCLPLFAQAQIDADDIMGAELLIIGQCENSMQCYFGHSSLRLVSRNGFTSNDYVIGYATSEGPGAGGLNKVAYSIKSLFKLELVTDLMRLSDTIDYNITRSNRRIYRLPLQLTTETKNKLISLINNSFFNSSNKVKDKSYNFLRGNCSGYLMKLLKDAGAPMKSYSVAVPRFMESHFNNSYLALYPSILIDNKGDINWQFERLPKEFYTYCASDMCASEVRSSFSNIWENEKFKMPVSPYKLDRPATDDSTAPAVNINWNNKKDVIHNHLKFISNN